MTTKAMMMTTTAQIGETTCDRPHVDVNIATRRRGFGGGVGGAFICHSHQAQARPQRSLAFMITHLTFRGGASKHARHAILTMCARPRRDRQNTRTGGPACRGACRICVVRFMFYYYWLAVADGRTADRPDANPLGRVCVSVCV